jgi:hypothetical protein
MAKSQEVHLNNFDTDVSQVTYPKIGEHWPLRLRRSKAITGYISEKWRTLAVRLRRSKVIAGYIPEK